MAKLKNDPITKDDITEYLTESSDFSFEILVLRKLTQLGFTCEHAGTYEDPVTKKTREFDIRAKHSLIDEENFKLDIRLSVECKNLKSNFPLVVHCMPREEHECFLDLIWSSEPQRHTTPFGYSRRIPLEKNYSPYKKLDPVGKSCDQVGRKATTNSELIGNDSDVFDKISQAINAAYDLIEISHYACKKNLDVVTIVIPVLIIPNDRAWTVWYDRAGKIQQEPTLTSNIEYYLDKNWVIGTPPEDLQVRHYLSHLEIVQIDNISEMIYKYTGIKILSASSDLKLLKSTYLK